jgi:hypothetical protein
MKQKHKLEVIKSKERVRLAELKVEGRKST